VKITKFILAFGLFPLLLFFLLLSSGCRTNSYPRTLYQEAEYDYQQGNYARAFDKLWILAQRNDPRALYAMGYLYYYGIGTQKDQDIARMLIRRSAAHNYPPAVTALKLIMQERFDQYVPFDERRRGMRP
jgi:TPR repeat protein